MSPPDCDYLLVESTYGDRLHDPENPKDALKRVINDAAERKSPVLIPSFAVGRTQEIIYLIRELEDEKAIPVLPVFVDSPWLQRQRRLTQTAGKSRMKTMRVCWPGPSIHCAHIQWCRLRRGRNRNN